MHFDIVEAIRQKQQKQSQTIATENGDLVDITIVDGAVVVNTVVSPAEKKTRIAK